MNTVGSGVVVKTYEIVAQSLGVGYLVRSRNIHVHDVEATRRAPRET